MTIYDCVSPVYVTFTDSVNTDFIKQHYIPQQKQSASDRAFAIFAIFANYQLLLDQN